MGRWSGQTQVLAIFMPTMCDTVSHSGMGPQVVGEHDNNCPHLAWLYSYIQLHLLLEELLYAFEPCTGAFESKHGRCLMRDEEMLMRFESARILRARYMIPGSAALNHA